MHIGNLLETKQCEKAWNALRFAATARRQGHEVKVCLMGEGLECEGLENPRFPVNRELRRFLAQGGELLACGSCRARKPARNPPCRTAWIWPCGPTKPSPYNP